MTLINAFIADAENLWLAVEILGFERLIAGSG